jgi:hypothetical protein
MLKMVDVDVDFETQPSILRNDAQTLLNLPDNIDLEHYATILRNLVHELRIQ